MLPSGLHLQAEQLAYDLALHASGTGDLRDAFLGVDEFPLLSVGQWLLDDLTGTDDRSADAARPAEVDRCGLLTIALLGALRTEATESIVEPAAFSDARQLAIVQLLTAYEALEIRHLAFSGELFWSRYTDHTTDALERSIAVHARPRARWSSPAGTVALVATELAGVDERVGDEALGMIEDLGIAFGVWADLASMPRDLNEGRVSYPIALAAEAARLPLDGQLPRAEIMGALVASDALATVIDTAAGHLAKSRRTAAGLGLPTFAVFTEAVAQAAAERHAALLGSGDTAAGGTRQPVILMSHDEPPLPKAIAMAEAFLLSDASLRESWETHREGLLGDPEVSSRFPAGLVLEILCRHGHDLRGRVDEFIEHAQVNGFRYYAHPRSDADSDTIGVCLRLLPSASGVRRALSSRPDGALSAALDCLERQVAASGAIPVWLPECTTRESGARPTLMLGEGCATVAAHLLLGLCAGDPDVRRETVVSGGSELVARLRRVGLGANLNYPPLYALNVFLRLLDELDRQPFDVGPDGLRDEVRRALLIELDRRLELPIGGAQQAALAIIACRAGGRSELVDRSLLRMILRQQRFDGSWAGEAFAMAPNRGRRVSAYSSSILTSALCFEALAGGPLPSPAGA